jgi:hypothetical protein
MRTRYQRGYLRLGHRKTRPACWEFLCGITYPRDGVFAARRSSEPSCSIPMCKTHGRPAMAYEYRSMKSGIVSRNSSLTVADLVDPYTETELAFDLGNEGKSHATKVVYKEFLGRWVTPTWGRQNIRAVRTTAKEFKARFAMLGFTLPPTLGTELYVNLNPFPVDNRGQ